MCIALAGGYKTGTEHRTGRTCLQYSADASAVGDTTRRQDRLSTRLREYGCQYVQQRRRGLHVTACLYALAHEIISTRIKRRTRAVATSNLHSESRARAAYSSHEGTAWNPPRELHHGRPRVENCCKGFWLRSQ